MVVCICRGVRDREVRKVIQEGARSTRDVAKACGAGTCCGACVPMIRDMVQAAEREAPPRPARADEHAPCAGL